MVVPDNLEAEGWAFRLMDKMFISPGRYVSTYASGNDVRICDPKIHTEQWNEGMKWDFEFGCGHHDTPTAGPVDGNAVGCSQGLKKNT